MIEHSVAPAVVGGLITAQIAADSKVPLEYYVATITVLGSIYGIVRVVLAVLSWIDKRIATKLDDHHKRIINAIKVLPCQRPHNIPLPGCEEEEGTG